MERYRSFVRDDGHRVVWLDSPDYRFPPHSHRTDEHDDDVYVVAIDAIPVGGVQWCVTHHGLNDETGENHTVRALVDVGDCDPEYVVFEDCCDAAELEPDGSFVPCDLRDLLALPKVDPS